MPHVIIVCIIIKSFIFTYVAIKTAIQILINSTTSSLNPTKAPILILKRKDLSVHLLMFLITFRIILPASCFKMLANQKSSKADRDERTGSFFDR